MEPSPPPRDALAGSDAGGPPPEAGPGSARDVRVTGAVQGVGFRPFVRTLAASLGLAGHVRNDSAGVSIHVEGPAAAVETFLARLVDDAPPLALVEAVVALEAERLGVPTFEIVHSETGPRADTLITADAATCSACLGELLDPADRRYRYPFINCTDCGPRFTIVRSVPYDRPNTTMAAFEMCPACRREYEDPDDRRFHAQPVACPECGPRLWFRGAAEERPTAHSHEALARAVAVLADGGILAVKGLGGYHLACDATREESVATLRRRKRRDERPFAVMFADLAEVVRHCLVDPEEADLLSGPRRPVVLLDRRTPARPSDLGAADHGGRGCDDPAAPADPLAPSVAPGVTTYGVFLPYTPLHHLLLRDFGGPLVMTSGNVSEEPIAFADGDAAERLAPIADAFLGHDRPIHVRTDDSVARVFRGQPYVLRRARGWAPLPVTFSGCDEPILAVGGHLKNAFALTRGTHAFVSHHIGDLENLETLRSLEEAVAHYRMLFSLDPRVVAHDLHPDYLSTRFALTLARAEGRTTVAVQHHEAHVASVAADTGHSGPLVGIAFDGAGYGPDGTIWGGEVFAGTPGAFDRVARLAHLPLPGGDAAVREPWRLALALLESCGRAPDPEEGTPAPSIAAPGLPAILRRPWPLVLRALRAGVNSPLTSSAGRLFDAVSSLLDLRHEVGYEGQAAILLEAAAARHYARAGLPRPRETPAWADHLPQLVESDGGPTAVIPTAFFGHAVLADSAAGVHVDETAARFHHALAWLAAGVAERVAETRGLDTVALGGGVFQNMLLLRLLAGLLEERGLAVLVHRSVPTNDGGLCLGQAETAAALVRSGGLGAGDGS